MRHAILLGRDLVAPGVGHVDAWEDRAAWGFSPGFPSPFSLKVDPNEDALFVVERGEVLTAGVADAHAGSLASEVAIVCALRAGLSGEVPCPAREILSEAVRALARAAEDGSEGTGQFSSTAILIARLSGGLLDLAWIGDCRAFGIRREGAASLGEARADWIGPEDAAALLAVGEGDIEAEFVREERFALESGSVVLLATDGLTEPVYGVPTLLEGAIANLVPLERPVRDSAQALLAEALRTDREHAGANDRGAEDNISFVLLRAS